jgi:hypothetical protein
LAQWSFKNLFEGQFQETESRIVSCLLIDEVPMLTYSIGHSLEQKDASATMKMHTVQGSKEGVVVSTGMLLVALGCGRLPGIFDITARQPFVVFGTLEGKVFAGLTACVVGSSASALPVYFYETGWIIPRRLVAAGKLDKVWLAVPEDVTAEELQDAFRSYFGAEWAEVLDAAEKSFEYNASNNAYFAVRDLRPVEDLTLEHLLEKTGVGQPPNIIVS